MRFFCFTNDLVTLLFFFLECLTSFLELVAAGIAGSPHMISATIISVSRVVYEFRSKYPIAICHLVFKREKKVVKYINS